MEHCHPQSGNAVHRGSILQQSSCTQMDSRFRGNDSRYLIFQTAIRKRQGDYPVFFCFAFVFASKSGFKYRPV